MRRVPAELSLIAVPVAAALVLSACNSRAQSSEPVSEGNVVYLDKSSIPADPAEQVYEQVCMGCHATGVGPEIRGRKLPSAAVKLFVRNGSRAMPAFTEAMIDDATLDQVAQLVAVSAAPPPQSPQ